jgi:hypothetical protein
MCKIETLFDSKSKEIWNEWRDLMEIEIAIYTHENREYHQRK